MSNDLTPIIDQWYQPSDKGELLRVVATDLDSGLIEVQHFDGSIEELDFDSWHDMNIDLAEEPEDWTGPYDDLEADDLGDTDATITGESWHEVKASAEDDDDEVWEDTRDLDERDIEADDRPIEPYASEEVPDADV